MRNRYRVPKKQWAKWSVVGRTVFNSLYWEMLNNQTVYKHPEAPLIKKTMWRTTAWNAAWEAATFADASMEMVA